MLVHADRNGSGDHVLFFESLKGEDTFMEFDEPACMGNSADGPCLAFPSSWPTTCLPPNRTRPSTRGRVSSCPAAKDRCADGASSPRPIPRSRFWWTILQTRTTTWSPCCTATPCRVAGSRTSDTLPVPTGGRRPSSWPGWPLGPARGTSAEKQPVCQSRWCPFKRRVSGGQHQTECRRNDNGSETGA